MASIAEMNFKKSFFDFLRRHIDKSNNNMHTNFIVGFEKSDFGERYIITQS